MVTSDVICPCCGQPAGVHLVWGYPSPEDMARWHHRFYLEGGRDPPAGVPLPDTECEACGHRWHSGAWAGATDASRMEQRVA